MENSKKSVEEEKQELPESSPMQTARLDFLLHNPEHIKTTFPHEYIKSWGIEKWIHNDAKSGYCMKLIVVYQDMWSSKGKFHYHKEKDETFLVVSGALKLDVEIDGIVNQLTLGPWSYFRVKPWTRHRFTAANLVCHFVEASTVHMEEDSYRCYWDYDKQRWIDV